MKFLSDNFIVLMLAVVLGFSPLQSIAASVSNCMNMGDTMSHQLKMSDKSAMGDAAQDNVKNDCCDQHSCDTSSHCASGAMSAVISSHGTNDMTYTVSNIYPNPIVSLNTFYPSSLYRPPKV